MLLARRLILGLVFVLAAACGSTSGVARDLSQHGLPVEPLEIVGHGRVHHFHVEIADNAASRERGLMFRKSLAPDAGMLFDFKTPQTVGFWMRNTLIPLDMLFIDKDGYIINLAANAIPLSEDTVPSRGVVLAVLELRGGRAAELGIEPGDRVRERIFRNR